MSNSMVYVVKKKFITPEVSLAPERLRGLSWAMGLLLLVASSFFLTGLLLASLPFALASAGGFATWGALTVFRKGHHERHRARYYSALETRWLQTSGFQAFRDFLMLIGLDGVQAVDIASALGVRTLSGGGYSEAKGYFLLMNAAGEKVITAVQVMSTLTKTGKLKVVATVLPDAERV